jgi:hypothetical protein
MKTILAMFLLLLPVFVMADSRFKLVTDKFIKGAREYIVIKDRKTDIHYIYNPKLSNAELLCDNVFEFMIWNTPVKIKDKCGKIVDARTFLEKLVEP